MASTPDRAPLALPFPNFPGNTIIHLKPGTMHPLHWPSLPPSVCTKNTSKDSVRQVERRQTTKKSRRKHAVFIHLQERPEPLSLP